MLRIPVIAVLSAAAIALPGPCRAGRADCALPACPVLYVIDGDTIIVGVDGRRTTIRLIGVDAPETKDPRKPVDPAGWASTRYLRSVLAGECVELELDEEVGRYDAYGRELAYVVRARDELFVNLALVSAGQARAIRHFNYGYRDAFCAAEARARSDGIGLWRRADR